MLLKAITDELVREASEIAATIPPPDELLPGLPQQRRIAEIEAKFLGAADLLRNTTPKAAWLLLEGRRETDAVAHAIGVALRPQVERLETMTPELRAAFVGLVRQAYVVRHTIGWGL